MHDIILVLIPDRRAVVPPVRFEGLQLAPPNIKSARRAEVEEEEETNEPEDASKTKERNPLFSNSGVACRHLQFKVDSSSAASSSSSSDSDTQSEEGK